jgi:hypothetical protein
VHHPRSRVLPIFRASEDAAAIAAAHRRRHGKILASHTRLVGALCDCS